MSRIYELGDMLGIVPHYLLHQLVPLALRSIADFHAVLHVQRLVRRWHIAPREIAFVGMQISRSTMMGGSLGVWLTRHAHVIGDLMLRQAQLLIWVETSLRISYLTTIPFSVVCTRGNVDYIGL